MTATPARVAALETLRATRRGDLADRALFRLLNLVPDRDRAWTHELVYGTLRLRGRIDHLLAAVSKRPLASLEPDILDILRLGAYQLLEMRSVPAYAAVSQSVELGKRFGGRASAGFINGVLQSLKRRGADLAYPSFEAEPAAYLSSWGSHPRWLVDRWLSRWSPDTVRRLIEANNERPVLYLRPLGIAPADAVERLRREGIGAESVAYAPDAVRLASSATVEAALSAVPAVVQDPAAGLVVRYADIPRDAYVVDLCAAPGGKALALAAGNAHTSARVAACDVSRERLERVRENRDRAGITGLDLVVADGRRTPLRAADAVLLDAPCTGTGTLRRHPDGRWRIGARDLLALTRLQAELLEGAAALVRPDGLLVYATCSLEPEENELQVEAFLERHPEFEPAPPGPVDPMLIDDAGRLFVTPQQTGFDGAFAARMVRGGAGAG